MRPCTAFPILPFSGAFTRYCHDPIPDARGAPQVPAVHSGSVVGRRWCGIHGRVQGREEDDDAAGGRLHVEQHHLLPLMQEMIYSHFSQGPAAHSSLWGSKAYEDKIETEEALARARKQS